MNKEYLEIPRPQCRWCANHRGSSGCPAKRQRHYTPVIIGHISSGCPAKGFNVKRTTTFWENGNDQDEEESNDENDGGPGQGQLQRGEGEGAAWRWQCLTWFFVFVFCVCVVFVYFVFDSPDQWCRSSQRCVITGNILPDILLSLDR